MSGKRTPNYNSPTTRAELRSVDARGIKARGKWARSHGEFIEKVSGKVRGSLQLLPDSIDMDGIIYDKMTSEEMRAHRKLHENTGLARCQYRAILPNGNALYASVERGRNTLLLVQLTPAKPDFYCQRGVGNRTDKTAPIPAEYRQPGEPTDGEIFRQFRQYCRELGIAWESAANPNDEGFAELETQRGEESAFNPSGWYAVSQSQSILNSAFPVNDLPPFIRRVEQPLSGEEPNALGMGPISAATAKRIRAMKRYGIERWEDTKIHDASIEYAKLPPSQRTPTEAEIIGILQSEPFNLTDSELSIATDTERDEDNKIVRHAGEHSEYFRLGLAYVRAELARDTFLADRYAHAIRTRNPGFMAEKESAPIPDGADKTVDSARAQYAIDIQRNRMEREQSAELREWAEWSATQAAIALAKREEREEKATRQREAVDAWYRGERNILNDIPDIILDPKATW